MTDKETLEEISTVLCKHEFPLFTSLLRDYIARTWPEKCEGCKHATPNCHPDGFCWPEKEQGLKPPTALPPGYWLETDGKTFRIVVAVHTVLAHTRTKEAAIGEALGHAEAEKQWKEVEA